MDKTKFSTGISLTNIQITDYFFKPQMETVRDKVITYQWEALNDNVEGASPSFCMRNFNVAAKLNEKRRQNDKMKMPVYQTDIFNLVPESMDYLEDRFYGFVFQDTDFYKWIEAVSYSLTQHPDSALEEVVDQAIDVVCAAQYEDGYLDTFYIINDISKRFTNLRDHHELYCLGHLIEGAVAYYEATGKDKLLHAAIRFADYIESYFGADEGKCKGYPGHEIAEMALVKLYHVTNEQRYLNLAKFFVDERGKRPYYFSLERGEHTEQDGYHYHQAHKPVRAQDEAVGHAVRAVYLYSGMADVAKYTEDEGLFAACERLWDNIEQKKLYINGGIGASPEGEAFSYNYNLPNDKMYNETCASIGLIFFARRMLEISPKSHYADVMERALYNGVLSGMSLDGKSFFYVNPLEVEPKGCEEDAQRKHVALPRQKWFGCACCPPNIARLMSSIASYAYSENDTTLFMHLYLGGKIVKQIGNQNVHLNINSHYPWKNTVEATIETEFPTTFTLALRIPGWCQTTKILLNHKETECEMIDGYAYLNREWCDGDCITLSFDMEPVFYQTHTSVRSNIAKTALMRGPVVYCLEEADNGNNLHLIEVDVQTPVDVVCEKNELGEIITLKARGRRILESDKPDLYTSFKGYDYEKMELKYIPYYTWCNRGVGEMQVYTKWYTEK